MWDVVPTCLIMMIVFICRGFSVTSNEKHHIFKPVSVQAMWYVTLSPIGSRFKP